MTEQYRQRLTQDVSARAVAKGILEHEAFFETIGDTLVEIGEVSDYVYAPHQRTGVQVDGYVGDPAEDDSIFKIFLVDFVAPEYVGTSLTRTEIEKYLRRGHNFLAKVLGHGFAELLEESSEVYGLAQLLKKRWDSILKIKFILISNRVLSSRVRGKEAAIKIGAVKETPVMLDIWDLGRLGELASQDQEREPLIVDLKDLGYRLPVLPANAGSVDYPSYLAVISGKAIADIYDLWGTRLLEQNVRVYLQARGSVNKGIQNTILHDPSMFFAYNNGLTATVEKIEIEDTSEGPVISVLHNLQIVNGGQTAASIYLMSAHSRKLWRRGIDPDLSDVFVQMKISQVPQSKSLEVVPNISRFANSQNKVSDADFFSNHPFHVEFEKLSQRLIAKPKEGSFVSTRWFYERMRGQYQNVRARLTAAEVKEFDAKSPRSQVITKTDLAKFSTPWEGKPHVAQLGAAKCFLDFANFIETKWKRDPSFCNEFYFKESVGKAIIFRETERIVSNRPWYEGGGNRAPIVVHTIGKIAKDARDMGKEFPLEKVWQEQALTDAMRVAVERVADAVRGVVLRPPAEGQLPTEWAKRPDCTDRVSKLEIDYPKPYLDLLVGKEAHRSAADSAKRARRRDSYVDAQVFVASQDSGFWTQILEWGEGTGSLSRKDVDLIDVARQNPLVTERQAKYLQSLYHHLRNEGLPHQAAE